MTRMHTGTSVFDQFLLKCARIATAQPHFFDADDLVEISGSDTDFNGTDAVIEVRSAMQFCIDRPSGHRNSARAVRKQGGIHKVLIEGNTIELAPGDRETAPVGIYFKQSPTLGEITGDLIIRDNRFRYVDGQTGNFTGYAIYIENAKHSIINDNFIETPSDGVSAIRISSSGVSTDKPVTCRIFDNRTPDGDIVGEADGDYLERFTTELGEPAENVIALSFLDK